jgi:chromosome segregation ATPase
MTNTNTRSAAMTQGRRADSARRRQRVLKALNDANNQGDEISVSGIARRAGVDRSFLYRHRDILEQIHAAEAQPSNAPGVGPAVSRASLQADLANAHQRAVRLAARVHQLEQRLSESLGEQAWHESGLGVPDDIDQLKQQIGTLQQHTIDLRLQLEERDQDLAAARAANRELMTQLNTPRTAT